MAASIKDVAKKAGVSVGTVSRALNGYKDVSDTTRQRIVDISKELGYTPNLSARNLSSKKKTNVAMLVSGLIDEKQTDEFTIATIKGAYAYASKHNLSIAMYAIDSEYQRQKGFEEFCREHSLSGALLLGLKTTDKYMQTLHKSKLPCVIVDTEVDGEYIGSVITDDEKAFEEITEYVINCNHRDLVLVYGRNQSMVSKKRYKGFCNAIQRHGIQRKDVEVIYTNFIEKTAYKKTKELIEGNRVKKGSAFICMSDITALGVIRALKSYGYQIPEDFSVTGYDGVSFGIYAEPAITTIDQNMMQKGYAAAKLLAKMLNGAETKKTTVVKHSLLERASVKK